MRGEPAPLLLLSVPEGELRPQGLGAALRLGGAGGGVGDGEPGGVYGNHCSATPSPIPLWGPPKEPDHADQAEPGPSCLQLGSAFHKTVGGGVVCT